MTTEATKEAHGCRAGGGRGRKMWREMAAAPSRSLHRKQRPRGKVRPPSLPVASRKTTFPLKESATEANRREITATRAGRGADVHYASTELELRIWWDSGLRSAVRMRGGDWWGGYLLVTKRSLKEVRLFLSVLGMGI